MLNTRNITTFNLDRDRAKEEERKTYHHVIDQLNFFGKRRLSKIDTYIQNIIKTITIDSLWEYTYPHTFTYLSDFHYDPEKQQITYVVNSVSANEEGYFLREEHTEKEAAFFARYKDMLAKLFALEQRKESIYAEHTIPTDSNIIAFDQIRTKEQRIKDNKDNNMIHGFSQVQMDNFVKRYHLDGLRRLIKLLNDLDASSKPYSIYNALRHELSSDYIEALLEWASTYSAKARFVLAKIAEERMTKHYELSGFPSYEERMTDNITKLL